MGSEELAANWFRITQAEAKLRRESTRGKADANMAHYAVGREVREAIARMGGTMPEDLPAPTQSIQQVERAERALLERRAQTGRQPSLFSESEGEDDL